MSRFRMPPQILRLVLLTLGIIGTYGVMRYFLKPDSFGEYGHYRGAALVERTALEPVFAGAKACRECHGEVLAVQDKHEHRRISCETCHSPARAHARDPDVKTTPFTEDHCLRCHSREPARPITQKQIDPKDHFEGKCLECHLPHHPKESPP
jgi:hypothetical protein